MAAEVIHFVEEKVDVGGKTAQACLVGQLLIGIQSLKGPSGENFLDNQFDPGEVRRSDWIEQLEIKADG